jgi:Tfp pilus assembly protein PilN
MKAVNLLPRDLRGAHSAPSAGAPAEHIPGGPGAVVVLGALALSVAAVAAYVVTGNTVKDRESRLASTTARQQAAESRAAALKPFADFAQTATKRVEAVHALAATRFDWEQAVRDLSRAIPADVTLSTLNGNLAGGGSVALRSAISAPAIELTGCAPDHVAVARMLSRLRSIDGVTRVSLSKSEQPQATAATTASAAAAGTNDSASAQATTPCGTGAHPSFQAVAFFQNDAALAATGVETSVGGTTTPATAAAAAAGGAAVPSAADTATPTSTQGVVR